MSLSNIIRNNMFVMPSLLVTQPPNQPQKVARIQDIKTFFSVATYPSNTVQPIDGSYSGWQNVFDTNIVADYLRVSAPEDHDGSTPLFVNIDYRLLVQSTSLSSFSVRLAYYNMSSGSLESAGFSDVITYDPSTNTDQPFSIQSIEFRAFSVRLPDNAEYAFLQILSGSTGSMHLIYDYATCTHVAGEDSSNTEELVSFQSTESTNIYRCEFHPKLVDPDGIEKDIQDLEADVTANKNDITSLQTHVTSMDGQLGTNTSNIHTNTVNLSGKLNINGSANLNLTNEFSCKTAQVNDYLTVAEGITCPSTNILGNNLYYNILEGETSKLGLTGYKGESDDYHRLYFSTLNNSTLERNTYVDYDGSLVSSKISTPNFVLNDGTSSTYFGRLATASTDTYLESGDTSTNQVIHFSAYNNAGGQVVTIDCKNRFMGMNNNNIKNVADPVDDTDVVTKQYVDTHPSFQSSAMIKILSVVPNFTDGANNYSPQFSVSTKKDFSITFSVFFDASESSVSVDPSMYVDLSARKVGSTGVFDFFINRYYMPTMNISPSDARNQLSVSHTFWLHNLDGDYDFYYSCNGFDATKVGGSNTSFDWVGQSVGDV